MEIFIFWFSNSFNLRQLSEEKFWGTRVFFLERFFKNTWKKSYIKEMMKNALLNKNSVHSVIVIVVGNEYSGPNLNPWWDCLHFTYN